ncbi:Kanadaptin, partial [Mucuna pruriens]
MKGIGERHTSKGVFTPLCVQSPGLSSTLGSVTFTNSFHLFFLITSQFIIAFLYETLAPSRSQFSGELSSDNISSNSWYFSVVNSNLEKIEGNDIPRVWVVCMRSWVDTSLPPIETNVKLMREVKMREAMQDREASVRRARQEASLAEGISWGMGEDAIEEDEDDAEEVTWQSFKGQLTEKQEKTREKIIKRMEKIANMKKEINSIRVKDISQGGLTQGQQTQIARNEQRITQILEELENLEETLNDSIRESIGARTGKMSHGKKKGAVEDEEEYVSDDDEFYDRTKRKPSHQKPGDNQSVETADTLLDKRDVITKEMNEKKELIMIEKNKILSKSESATQDDVGDSLDAYMSGLSSQLVYDKSVQLEKELSTLQSELDRICYLLKIADPSGEAAKKRELKLQEPKPNKSEEVISITKKKPPAEAQKSSEPSKADNKKPPVETLKISKTSVKADGSIEGEKAAAATLGLDKLEPGSDRLEAENVVFAVPKPQWLGAVKDRVTDDTQQLMPSLNQHEMDESNQFVDYKDRSKILGSGDNAKTSLESKIESAAPGLILRKRKQAETTATNSNGDSQQLTSSTSGEKMAEDAVALLLKHNRGLYANDDEERYEGQERRAPKRVLGPEKPSFLNNEMDYDTWVPPEGQSGDGRTSLNDRYGY